MKEIEKEKNKDLHTHERCKTSIKVKKDDSTENDEFDMPIDIGPETALMW